MHGLPEALHAVLAALRVLPSGLPSRSSPRSGQASATTAETATPSRKDSAAIATAFEVALGGKGVRTSCSLSSEAMPGTGTLYLGVGSNTPGRLTFRRSPGT